MAPKSTPATQRKGKQPDRQASVEDDNSQSSGENHREDGQMVTSSMGQPVNLPGALPLVPSFSEQQVHDLVNIVHSVMQQYFAPSNQPPPNQPPSNQTTPAPIPSVETSPSSHPAPTTAERPPKALRAEQVGYFDPEYQQEQGDTSGPVANAGKYVYYRDVYVFVDRLKAMAKKNDVKPVISECLRGTALMWYSTELTDLERDLLEDSSLDQWYSALISHFKIRTSDALSQINSQMYSLNDVPHTSPRAFIQHILHLAKAAEMDTPYHQVTIAWNSLAVSLRRDIPEPRPSTTIGQFLNQVDSKKSI